MMSLIEAKSLKAMTNLGSWQDIDLTKSDLSVNDVMGKVGELDEYIDIFTDIEFEDVIN